MANQKLKEDEAPGQDGDPFFFYTRNVGILLKRMS